MAYLSNNIAATLALQDPGQECIQASQVANCILLQQQGQGCNFVTCGSATPHLL